MADWLTGKEFYGFYTIFQDHLSKRIMEIDNINQEQPNKAIQEQPNKAIKDAFWEYLQVYMANEKKGLKAGNESVTDRPISRLAFKSLKTKVGANFPILKTIYRKHIRPIISDKKQQMHYEVMNPRSPYYKDFQHVMDSFTGKDLTNI